MSVFTYKCPNCDAPLTFDAAKQKFVCEYCMSEFTHEELLARVDDETVQKEAGQEEKAKEQSSDGVGADDALVYTCPSCGAEIVTDSTTAASFCYYCHNPVVLAGRLSGEFRPDLVLPFSIEREEAQRRFLEWAKKKKLAPKGFADKKNIEKLTGVYFPFFIVSKSIYSTIEAKGTRVRVWRSGDIEHTETKVYKLMREGSVLFEDIIKNALDKEERILVENILPFETEKAQPFSMAYLSGFMAQKRNLDKEAFQAAITEEVKDYSESLLRDTFGAYNSISNVYSGYNPIAEGWKYALMPVWTLTYKSEDKIYYYAMNAQTGKVCGDVPISMKRMLFRFLSVTLPVFAVLCILGGLFL